MTLEELIASKSDFRQEIRSIIYERDQARENGRESELYTAYQVEEVIMSMVKERLFTLHKELIALAWYDASQRIVLVESIL